MVAAATTDNSKPDNARESMKRVLLSLIHSEGRSLFRYLDPQNPYTDKKTVRVKRAVREIAADSLVHEEVLIRLLDLLQGELLPDSFDMDSAFLNDASWEVILPELIRDKKKQVARYEAALAERQRVDRRDRLGLKDVLTELLNDSRSHLRRLEVLQRSITTPVG
ncbi:MAG TPA: hypothetical protein ENJ06_03715 [Phycisphaeraceae bacterium]|nr:hypothetical protein [Phycisphaeraceae bacterium]